MARPGRRAVAPARWIDDLGARDLALFRAVARSDVAVVGPVLRPLSRTADHSVLWVAIALGLAGSGGRFARRAALRGMIGLGAASAIANLVAKRVARRRRPPPRGVPAARLLHRPPTSPAMPSGHAASAFAFAVGAGSELPALAPPLGALATAVALSRVYVGVHYPGDVAAGAALGTAVALAGRRLWPLDRHGDGPAEPAAGAPRCAGGRGAVVVNPGSGGGDGDDPIAELRRRLPEARVHELDEGDDLLAALRAAASDGEVLGIAGGDGSANAAATVALEHGRPLLVVPEGTHNHLARDLGLRDVESAATAVEGGRAVRVDVGTIAGRPFLNTASFGNYADLVDTRKQLESRIGKWPATVLATARMGRRTQPVAVTLDGEDLKVWAIFVGNCRYEPAGLVPSRRSRLDDGRLDVRIVHGAPPAGRKLVAALLLGPFGRSRAYEGRLVRELRVLSRAGDLRLARDGETFAGSNDVTIAKDERQLVVYKG